MSAVESFAEIAERLKREREAEPRRDHNRVGDPGRRSLPAPLRLPAGDPRRRPPFVPGERARQPGFVARKAGSEDLPPPLFTGILPHREDGPHKITAWAWDPDLCFWIGRCAVCQYRFRAGREMERRLEREVEEWCDEHPVEVACGTL